MRFADPAHSKITVVGVGDDLTMESHKRRLSFAI